MAITRKITTSEIFFPRFFVTAPGWMKEYQETNVVDKWENYGMKKRKLSNRKVKKYTRLKSTEIESKNLITSEKCVNEDRGN